jgi:SH3 domain protein
MKLDMSFSLTRMWSPYPTFPRGSAPLSNFPPQAGERANEKSNLQARREKGQTSKAILNPWTLLMLLAVSPAAIAFDFVSVAEPAILYDANSLKAKKMFVATRYLPLEQVVMLESWVKVRDVSGKLFWIEKRQVSNKRYVMVTVPLTSVRSNPEDNAEVVFKATQQLALEWLGNAGNGWVKVRHADGTMGYVKSVDVWGD